MSNNLELSILKNKSELLEFWRLLDKYIDELSVAVSLGDEFDLEYFYSDEYRDTIENLRTREINPLKIFLVKKKETIIGFLMYVTYFDEDGKCFLMEYNIEPNYRGKGYGKLIYFKAEQYIKEEGALYIELTPTNDKNERFWSSVGFMKTMDVDEDNKYYYRKSLIEQF